MKNLELAPQVYPKIGVYFTVDTLEYLHKGGRIAPPSVLWARL